ncbi:MAG: cupin domain-containing protein [Spirochaetia bacterium]|jgi:quercetin dioxygenase-like cupin family protein
MKEGDFSRATSTDRQTYIVRPHEQVPITVLVEGSNSHLVRGSNMMLSFLTMKAGSAFELHSHAEEQIMIVLEGFCDEVIENKMYRVGPGDVIHLPANVRHGAFIREVDCKTIDVFAPARADYAAHFHDQHPRAGMRFT